MSAAARSGGTVVVAVGDELLAGFQQDTNSQFIAERVRDTPHPVRRIEVVADDRDDIAEAVRRAVGDPTCTRVLVCGGVGPTPDDRTFEAVAHALEVPLEEHPVALAHITGILGRMAAAGWVTSAEVTPANRRMARVPAGGTVLENRRGMAPAMAYPLAEPGGAAAADPAGARRLLAILPGVPRELRTIVEEVLLPAHFAGGAGVHMRELVYRFAVEADFAGPMEELARAFPGVAVGSYPHTETRELVLRIRGTDAAAVAEAAALLRAARPGAVSER